MRKTSPSRTCQLCGAGYVFVRGKTGGSKYCGPACAAEAIRRSHLTRPAERECGHCGREFTHAGGRTAYCTAECAGLAKAARDSERQKAKRPASSHRICQACGVDKGWEEFKNKACLVCVACGPRSALARRAERARIAERTGKRYRTKDEVAKDKAARLAREANRRCTSRLLRTMTRRASLVIKRAKAVRPVRAFSNAEPGTLSSHPSSVAFRHRYNNDQAFRVKQLAKCRARNLRRQGRTMQGDDTVSGAIFDATECPYCGNPIDRRNAVMDHMQPLALGGAHTAGNVIVCCWDCNSRKGAMPLTQWLTMIGAERAAAVEIEQRRLSDLRRGPGSDLGQTAGNVSRGVRQFSGLFGLQHHNQ